MRDDGGRKKGRDDRCGVKTRQAKATGRSVRGNNDDVMGDSVIHSLS